MNQTPAVFVRNTCHSLSETANYQLHHVAHKFGYFAGIQCRNRYSVDLYLRLSKPEDFCESNFGQLGWCITAPQNSCLKPNVSLFENISANKDLIDEVTVYIDEAYSNGFYDSERLDSSKCAAFSKLLKICRQVKISLFSNHANTKTEQLNLQKLLHELRIPQDLPNVSVDVFWVDDTCKDTVLNIFGALNMKSLQLDECLKSGYVDELLNMFFKPNLERLLVENDCLAEKIVKMWTKQQRFTRKFFLGTVGPKFQDVLGGFQRAKITCDKNGLKLSGGRAIPNIVPYVEQIREDVIRGVKSVGRFLYKKHPKLRNYYCCVFLVTTTAEIMSVTEFEDTYDTGMLKKCGEMLDNQEFASISEKVCVFFCDRKQ